MASSFDLSLLTPTQLAAIPALQPPTTLESNFVDPANKNLVVHILFSFIFALVTTAVAGRIYIRFFYLKQAFVGDYFLIFAYIFFVVQFGLSFRATVFPGVFVHMWDIRLIDLAEFLHMVLMLSTVYAVTILPLKIAILLEWLRIFVPTGNRNFVYWASYLLLWANVGFYISIIIALNVACSPYEYNWNKLIPGNCDRVNTTDTNLSASVFNLISDLLILLIPQQTIWKLHMAPRKKIGVSVIFATGILGCCAAVARLVETVYHATSPDFTYTFSAVMLCSGLELTCGFFVICIPTFPKAFQALQTSKLKNTLSFWTWGSSLKALRPTNKENSQGSTEHSHSSPFSKIKSKRDSQNGTNEYELDPIRKLHNKDSTEQSLGSYKDAGSAEQGIVRTTYFEVSEGYQTIPEPPVNSYKHHQQWD